ncbi:MAG: aldolase/citrate lyase family protein, partial [Xanthobacteraceae bacterium]
MRSFLFGPADSERKLAKGAESDADAIILDLEDSVAAERKAGARET